MSQKVWKRKTDLGAGVERSLAALRHPQEPKAFNMPSKNVEELKADGDSFTLESFTTEDAWDLGHLLYARLRPLAPEKSTVISIALANSSQVLFQCATGSGTTPDNERWVQRKRNAVLRFGCSTWMLHCKFSGDEAEFARKMGMDPEQAGKYAIHGGGVPIRVQGVEGVVAVVIVSGLKQWDDHGAIVDVIKENWE